MLDRTEVLTNLGQCARCRQCRLVCEIPIAQTMRPVCPAGEYFKFDAYYGTGRVSIAKHVLLGNTEMDETIAKAIYACGLCGSCYQQCPIIAFNPMQATMVLREMAVENGLADAAYLMPDTSLIEVSLDEDAASDTGLFVGTVALSDSETVRAVANALKSSGVSFKAVNADAGEFLQRKGDNAAFEAKIAENIAAFKAAGIRRLIAHDPMTYKVLKLDYGLDAEGISVVFWLELAKPTATPGTGRKATLHDSSHLGRYLRMFDEPREAIKTLGFDLVEMVRTGENAMSTSAYPDVLPQMAAMAARETVMEAVEAGAQVLIATGRNSAAQLKKTAAELGTNLEVHDLVHLF